MAFKKFFLRRLLPHFIISFIFWLYILLGACGLYFLIFPTPPAASKDESDLDRKAEPTFEPDYIEMHVDIHCNEAKRRLDEMDRIDFEYKQRLKFQRMRKFTFARAVLVCFQWTTTIGNRWLGDWEYSDRSITHEINPSGGLGGKFYAIIYMLIGIPLTFLMLLNFAALLHDALNLVFFTARRQWHAKSQAEMEESFVWNPFWFLALLISYIFMGSLLIQYAWLHYARRIPFPESLWNCASLILCIGESSVDIFVFPPTSLGCLAQITYSVFGLIILGAFLKSFLPLARKIYQPKIYTISISKMRLKKSIRKPITVRQEKGTIARAVPEDMSLTPPRPKKPITTPRSIGPYVRPPKSILRQRNGAFSFEPKRSDSLESMSTDDLLLPPMVRFAVPTQPEESLHSFDSEPRRPEFEKRIDIWPEYTEISPGSSRSRPVVLAEPPRFEPPRPPPMDSPLLFSVSPESIPYADERNSTVIM